METRVLLSTTKDLKSGLSSSLVTQLVRKREAQMHSGSTFFVFTFGAGQITVSYCNRNDTGIQGVMRHTAIVFLVCPSPKALQKKWSLSAFGSIVSSPAVINVRNSVGKLTLPTERLVASAVAIKEMLIGRRKVAIVPVFFLRFLRD